MRRRVVSYVITARMLVCSQFGMTALMGAVFYSALEVTKLLLQRGASIHIKGLVRVASLRVQALWYIVTLDAFTVGCLQGQERGCDCT